MKGRDIVIVSIQAWYTDIGSTCKNIAEEFSRNNRVLYINVPLDRKTIITYKNDPNIQRHLSVVKKNENDLVEVHHNLWNYYPHHILESINWIPSTKMFLWVNKINIRRFAKDIKSAVERLGFKNYILFNDNDIFRSLDLKEILNPELYIYYRRDHTIGFKYWKKHGVEVEPYNIAKADIAIGNSPQFLEYIRKFNSNSYYVGTGCNLSLFDVSKTYEIPGDVIKIPRPIVGYVGVLTDTRLDPQIIRTLAQKKSDWNIVLVGPADEYFSNCDLHKYSNVHFLGKKPVSELPAYISSFDVCINPQIINEITIGNYPLKVDEYLALGKPVVATKTDAMLEIFGDCVYNAETPEEYLTLIERALKENSETLRVKRIQLARSHTWENCVNQIYDIIEQTLSSKSKIKSD